MRSSTKLIHKNTFYHPYSVIFFSLLLVPPLLPLNLKGGQNAFSNYFLNCPSCGRSLSDFQVKRLLSGQSICNNANNQIPFTVISQALKEHIMTCRHTNKMANNMSFFNSNHLPLQFPAPPHRLPLLTPPSPAMSISPPIKMERSESTSPRGQSPETHSCSQCSASFLSRDLLDKHEILHSPNDSVVSTCFFLNSFFNWSHSKWIPKLDKHDCPCPYLTSTVTLIAELQNMPQNIRQRISSTSPYGLPRRLVTVAKI